MKKSVLMLLFTCVAALIYQPVLAAGQNEIAGYSITKNPLYSLKARSGYMDKARGSQSVVDVFIRRVGEEWIVDPGVDQSELLTDSNLERLVFDYRSKTIYLAAEAKFELPNGRNGNVQIFMDCATKKDGRKNGYSLCNSYFGVANNKASDAVRNVVATGALLGLNLITGGVSYRADMSEERIREVVDKSGAINFAEEMGARRTREVEQKKYEKYVSDYKSLNTTSDLLGFAERYRTFDPDGLAKLAADRGRYLAYVDDYQRAHKSTRAMRDFIERYTSEKYDPDFLIPSVEKLKKSMVAEKAVRFEIGDTVCSYGKVFDGQSSFEGGAHGFIESLRRNSGRLQIRIKGLIGKPPYALSGANWKLREFEIAPESIIWSTADIWENCTIEFKDAPRLHG